MGELRPDWRPDLTYTEVRRVTWRRVMLTVNSPHFNSDRNLVGLATALSEVKKETRRAGRLCLSIPGEPCHKKSGQKSAVSL